MGRTSDRPRATTALAIQDAATAIHRLATDLLQVGTNDLGSLIPVELSAREQELLRLIVEEALPYKEIAYRTGYAYGTIKVYTQRLFRRLGVRSALELCVKYWRGRLLQNQKPI